MNRKKYKVTLLVSVPDSVTTARFEHDIVSLIDHIGTKPHGCATCEKGDGWVCVVDGTPKEF